MQSQDEGLSRSQKKNKKRGERKARKRAEAQAGVPPEIVQQDTRPVTPPQVARRAAATSKRTVTSLITAESPEHKRLPDPKRSKINLANQLPAQDGPSEDPNPEKKPAHRGKRGRKTQVQTQHHHRRVADARRLLHALASSGAAIHNPKDDIDSLPADQVIELVEGFRSFKSSNGEKVVFATELNQFGRRWRNKHGLTMGEFQGKVLDDEDIKKYGFRVFKANSFYAYDKKKDGTEELAFSACFRKYDDMSIGRREDIEYCGKLFAHAHKTGPPVTTNGPMNAPEGGGDMGGLGWRGASEEGYRAGTNARTGANRKDYEDYYKGQCRLAATYGGLFQDQAEELYGLNNEFVLTHRLPKLDEKEFGLKSGSVPASNLTFTTKDFRNAIHRDKDATRFTFGAWFHTYEDGSLVLDPKEIRSITQGGYFVLPDYGIAIDFGECAGIVTLTWRGPVDFHGTTKSTTRPGYHRWGSSIQCTKRILERVNLQRQALAEQAYRKTLSRSELRQLGKVKVKVLKINDYYARTGTRRPQHPNPNWWEDSWKVDTAVDVEEREVYVDQAAEEEEEV
ncbi:hypothetical protein RhiJN_18691 [Ceratobasidium sp. AG-Ba]|nr:hypothetical protein RhiJN_18691 [Ceratobasidium sp. AG-Ba]